MTDEEIRKAERKLRLAQAQRTIIKKYSAEIEAEYARLCEKDGWL